MASFSETNQAAGRTGKTRFFGNYEHAIDAKGRIIIPTAYRKALGATFTMTLNLDDNGIAIYPDEAFEAMIDELYSMNRRSPSVQLQQAHVAKYSYPGIEADSQGRVLLPAKLRKYALGDAENVEISGAIDHIRVVDARIGAAEDDYYHAHSKEINEDCSQLTE